MHLLCLKFYFLFRAFLHFDRSQYDVVHNIFMRKKLIALKDHANSLSDPGNLFAIGHHFFTVQ